MTSAEWKTQWKRLRQFRINPDATADEVSLEWFQQLQHYHVDAVERGITELIGQQKDTFLPGVGALRELITNRINKYDQHRGGCQTCHGATWIDAWPVMWEGRLYEMFARCPDCGIPAPEMKRPHPSARPATKTEYEEWKAGRYARNIMPPGLEAKPMKPGKREQFMAERREFFDQLRIKLFGTFDENNGGVA
jgi:hypothetical protein